MTDHDGSDTLLPVSESENGAGKTEAVPPTAATDPTPCPYSFCDDGGCHEGEVTDALRERVRGSLPAHYSDCDRLQVYSYGTRYGDCDCTASEDIKALLDGLERPYGD